MMGVGKSTIGRMLAKRLKLEFIDIDSIIEIKEKNNIKEIFENKGEAYFRKIEKKISIEEKLNKNLILESISSIQAGINPKVVEQFWNKNTWFHAG